MAEAQGTVSFDWGDGTYSFRLGLGEIRQLQEKTGIGPLALFNRISSGGWMIDDLRETLRLGLIGAGMRDLKALALIRDHFDARPKIDQKEPVLRILSAFLIGEKDDPVGKPRAAEEPAGATGSSPSPPSTASVAP